MKHTAYGATTVVLAPVTGNRRPEQRALSPVEAGILFFIALLLVVGTVAASHRSAAPRESVSVRVERGDTLWTLARTHPVEGMTTEQTADLIASMNGLRDGALSSGRTILVPAAVSTSRVASR